MALDLNVTKMAPGDSLVLRGEKKLTVNIMMLGMGWDERKTPGTAIDADPAIILRNAAGQTPTADWILYFGNDKNPPAWGFHTGDNLTGAGEIDSTGDDERMFIDLDKVPAEVTHIDVFAHVYDGKARKQTFGDLPKGAIRICNAPAWKDEKGTEIARMDLTSDDLFAATGMLFVQIVRKGATWEVKAHNNADAKFADVSAAASATSPIL